MNIDMNLIKETRALSCLECGKCTGACPVARYTNEFSPRLTLIKTLRNTHPNALKSADLWSCLTCQRCDQICPSHIQYSDLMQLIRTGFKMDVDDGTCSHGGILQSISRIMTAKHIDQQRLDWVDKKYQTSEKSEYLYFSGCLPYFDVLFEELDIHALDIARSTLKILNYFDIEPQVLPNEKCCGHDFYWNGDFENFKKLAEFNLKQIKKSGAKTIITSCPECYRTLQVDYPKFFGSQDYRVTHISEFIADKAQNKDWHIKSESQVLTFHDPCRLGRHLDIYEAPRTSLKAMQGIEIREMAHHHNRSICCGVTGWKNCSQISKQIQKQRLHEAKDSGADTLVTACAKCQIHFQCAMQDKQLKEDVKINIKDITQVVAERLH
jgi:Fe-S oxidoreductase